MTRDGAKYGFDTIGLDAPTAAHRPTAGLESGERPRGYLRQVRDQLWVGQVTAAENPEQLAAAHITHVVSLVFSNAIPPDIDSLQEHMADGESLDADQLQRILDWVGARFDSFGLAPNGHTASRGIEEAKQALLVVCMRGNSRSVATASLLLSEIEQIPIGTAYHEVTSVTHSHPNETVLNSLGWIAHERAGRQRPRLHRNMHSRHRSN